MLSFLRGQDSGGMKHDKEQATPFASDAQGGAPKGPEMGRNLGDIKDSSETGGVAPSSGFDIETKQYADEQEYITVANHSKNAHKSTILLGVLFGLGMLCLWFMIKKSTPPPASASSIDTEEKRIETAITRLTGFESEMSNRMGDIVKKFYEFSDVYQVKVDELIKDPFKLEIFLSGLKKADGSGDDINIERIRQQQLRQQAKGLNLLSIMQTDQGYCCMIDDTVLYEGDSIKGFNVRQITEDFVKLESESSGNNLTDGKESLGIQIILRLSE